MASDRPEFRPIEMTRSWPTWPFAIAGALVVACALYAFRRTPEGDAKAKLASVVGKVDAAKAVGQALSPTVETQSAHVAKPAETTAAAADPKLPELALPKANEGPNVLGGPAAAAAAGHRVSMVPSAELERERARTRGAQKAMAAAQKQIQGLQAELQRSRAELASFQRAHAPRPPPPAPPPTDSEQILQTLAPVLQSATDGRN